MADQTLSYSRTDMQDVGMTSRIPRAQVGSGCRAKATIFAADHVTLVALRAVRARHASVSNGRSFCYRTHRQFSVGTGRNSP